MTTSDIASTIKSANQHGYAIYPEWSEGWRAAMSAVAHRFAYQLPENEYRQFLRDCGLGLAGE